MIRALPLLLAAFVVITVYALVLRRRFRGTPVFDEDVRELRARATLLAGEADEAIELARTDLDYRTAQLGEHATRDLTSALAAAQRDRDDVLRLLDLIGAGRQDVDDMLDGAVQRVEGSTRRLRSVRREVEGRARGLADLPARLGTIEREVADLHRVWQVERDRSERLRGAHPTTGRPATPASDLAYASRLLEGAVDACRDARAREEAGDSRGALGQVEAAEALADEAAGLLDPPR